MMQEGLNDGGFVNMKITKNYNESRKLHKEDYLLEDKVEPKNTKEVPSNSLTVELKQDDRKAYDNKLLEKILDRENMNLAYKNVKRNKGSHGIDKLTVDELLTYLREHGAKLREEILSGRYSPKAVRRIEIPKDNGKIRKLGLPTVVDRVVQQAMLQVLTPIFEETFSDYSFGFRPKRSAHDALRQSKNYINEGYTYIIDIDLKSYFDTVNQDILMGSVFKEIKDKRVLSLIRKYLQAGVLEQSIVVKSQEGLQQGGPLSPLLSNVMLNELDKELESRGLRFVRYADDCNVYVKSKRAAERVMDSITSFIEKKLKLTVNTEKSSICKPSNFKFLGYSFYGSRKGYEFRVHKKSFAKLKSKLKYLTGRSRIGNIQNTYEKLRQIVIGWVNYFKLAKMKTRLKEIDEWLRRRIRMCYWKQWKKISTKARNLRKLGIDKHKAWEFANTRKGYWRIANSQILNRSITNARLEKAGLISLSEVYARVS
jgi:group II intron reverse transcriptase/maturase